MFAFLPGVGRQPQLDPLLRLSTRPPTATTSSTSASPPSPRRATGTSTAATDVGRSLAIAEALIGQIYLVTVVAAIVGGLGAARRA